MNKRLVDKLSVVVFEKDRKISFCSETPSDILAMNLLAQIIEKKLSAMQLPQALNSSWQILLQFTDGSFVHIDWFEREIPNKYLVTLTKFTFHFHHKDWEKLQEMMK